MSKLRRVKNKVYRPHQEEDDCQEVRICRSLGQTLLITALEVLQVPIGSLKFAMLLFHKIILVLRLQTNSHGVQAINSSKMIC
jgi:hypothetical protein